MGLMIKFNKSEVSFFGKAVERKDMYAYIFTCRVGNFSFKYLGAPMHVRKLLIVIGRRPRRRFKENSQLEKVV